MSKLAFPGSRGLRRMARETLSTASAMVLVLTTISVPAVGQAPPSKPPSASPRQVMPGDYVRTSQYIAGRTGRRIAIDVYLPTSARPGRIPVVLTMTPYHRADMADGKLRTALDTNPQLAAALLHGYAVAALDVPTRGASFGTIEGAENLAPEKTLWDLHDAVRWLTKQPWSDGNVGTYGCSYVGVTQMMAAVTAPPGLRAIVPGGFGVDPYSTSRANGISSASLGMVDQFLRMLDVDKPAPPVDADGDGALLAKAIAEHRLYYDAGRSVLKDRAERPFRDSVPSSPDKLYGVGDLWMLLPQLKMGGTASLYFSGWSDPFVDAAGIWQNEMRKAGVPAKLVIGPWKHCEWYTDRSFDTTAAHMRWYDRWLRGIRNGAEDDPAVRYYLKNAPAGKEWRTATSWPPPDVERVAWYLGGENVAPGTDGAMVRGRPGAAARDAYRVDYATTTQGIDTRYSFTPGTEETSALDRKGMTYTTPPMKADMDILGYPVLAAWIDSDATDADLFAYVEIVDEGGVSRLITEGAIRASNRALNTAPWDNLGLPWHGSFAADQKPLTPGEPVEVKFTLNPIAYHIPKGSRVRLTLTGFDKGNWDTPVRDPVPTIGIHRGGGRASFLDLPMQPARP